MALTHSPNLISRTPIGPPFDTPISRTLPPGPPRDIQETLHVPPGPPRMPPRAHKDVWAPSKSARSTIEKRWKYTHLASKDNEKQTFYIFVTLLGPPRKPPPSGALAPERPKGPYTRPQVCPKAHWGPNLSPKIDFCFKLKYKF